MITSNKDGLIGHRWRKAIADELIELSNGSIDIYGFGRNPMRDKADALDDYFFSVIIENSPSDYYWTEKLADCFLGYSMPIYAGARKAKTDLEVDFPELEFGEDVSKAARKILNIVENYVITTFQ